MKVSSPLQVSDMKRPWGFGKPGDATRKPQRMAFPAENKPASLVGHDSHQFNGSEVASTMGALATAATRPMMHSTSWMLGIAVGQDWGLPFASYHFVVFRCWLKREPITIGHVSQGA